MSEASSVSLVRARWFLALSVVVTLLLYYVPQLRTFGYPFILCSTYVHEMGHGVAAVLMGGDFIKFEMWSNASGVATYAIAQNACGLRHAIISAGGLCGPAIIAAIGFWMGRSEKRARVGLFMFGGIVLLALLLVVRNGMGVAMSIAMALVLIGLGLIKRPWVHQLAMLFLSTELALCVFSRSDYLFMEKAQTTAGLLDSDVTQISKALFLPYWFWGGVCAIFSLLVLFFGIRGFFRRAGSSSEASNA